LVATEHVIPVSGNRRKTHNILNFKKRQSYYSYLALLILLLVSFSNSCSNSNEDIEKHSGKLNCNGLYWASLTSGKTNELFYGVENKVKLIAPGVSSADILMAFTGGKGEMNKVEGPYYTVKPTSFEKVTITLENVNTNETKNFVFKIKELPTPLLSINKDGLKMESSIRSENIKELDRIYLVFENLNYTGACKIEIFQTSLIRSRKIIRNEQNIGGVFSKKTRELISMATKGDMVIFSRLKGICAGDSTSRNLSPMILEII